MAAHLKNHSVTQAQLSAQGPTCKPHKSRANPLSCPASIAHRELGGAAAAAHREPGGRSTAAEGDRGRRQARARRVPGARAAWRAAGGPWPAARRERQVAGGRRRGARPGAVRREQQVASGQARLRAAPVPRTRAAEQANTQQGPGAQRPAN